MALLNSITGGGGSGFKLAPDLAFPSRLTPSGGYATVTVDPSGALTTMLSLTGNWLINGLYLSGFLAETVTVKLTIDGVVIWNDTFTPATTLHLNTMIDSSAPNGTDIVCMTSFLLELQTATDTSVSLFYSARPIL